MRINRPKNYIDLTGQRFGILVVLRDSRRRTPGGAVLWRCQCGCGKRKNVWGNALREGHAKSCGCRKGYRTHGQTAVGQRTHGQTCKSNRSPTYYTWSGMISRCRNPKDRNFPYYGGRGIKVCERWKGKTGLITFMADVGKRPAGKTLDRKDVNGDYEPTNVRWATPKEQANNRRARLQKADDAVAVDAGFGQ